MAPTPMSLDVATGTVVALLLAAARCAAWLVVAPPFSSRAVGGPVKALLSVGLALPVVSRQPAVPPVETGALVSALVAQVLTGAALGFLVQLVLSAVQAAGDLLDVFGGFTLAFAFDPLMQSGGSVFGRLYQTTALTLLLSSGAHLVVLQGLFRSYDAVPLDGGVSVRTLDHLLTGGATQLFLGALQIAAPVVAVLFLADVGLGLLTRVAPALNAFSLGFPLKILLTLLVVGSGFTVLPGVVSGLVGDAVGLLGTALRR